MKVKLFHAVATVVLLAILTAGCSQDEPMLTEQASHGASASSLQKAGTGIVEGDPSPASIAMLSEINAQLEAGKKDVRVAMMEFVTADGTGEYGMTVIAKNVGNKQLGAHFVPGDARRGGFPDISYITDKFEGAATGGLTSSQTTTEIDRAMAVWGSQDCSGALTITNFGAYNYDFGYVQYLLGFGGRRGWAADLTHAGWLPKAFFDAIAPNGGRFILGVTFTFIWVGPNGPTDIDNNGKADVAFREIYYNNNFAWRQSAYSGGNDFQAFGVILHEAGHGVSQAHFGQVFLKNDNTVQYAPQAVMNAVVSRRTDVSGLLGTDIGGHCSIWASWPNN